MSIFITISLIAFSILLEGFFSGSETGLISINRIKLRHLVYAKIKVASQLQELLNRPDRFLGTTLVGTNISVIIASCLFANLIVQRIGVGYEWLTTVCLAPFILIFGEILPKSIFRQTADRIILRLVPLLRFFSIFLFPVVWLVSSISNLILLPISGFAKPTKKSPFVTREELRYLVQESEREGVIEPHERSLIYSIFDFSTKKVKDIMIPLKKMVSLDSQKTVEDLRQLVRKTRYARIPIYEKQSGNFAGIINIFDCIYEKTPTKTLSGLVRPVMFLSQDEPIDRVLLALQLKHQQMAVLVDKAEKAVGLVTIEDLLEEIVGEM